MRLFLIILSITTSALTGYSQSGLKLKKKSLEVNMRIINNKLKVTITEFSEKEILDVSKASGRDLKEYIYSDEAFESKPEIKASTQYYLKNGKPKFDKDVSITTEDYISRGIFYSGTKRYTVTFPKVQTGSVLACATTITYNEPRLLPPFYFDDYLSCDVSELIIHCDNNIDLGFIDYNHDNVQNLVFEETKLDNETTYKWTAKNLQGRVYESNSRGSSCTSPHTIFYVKSYQPSKDTEERINVLRHKEDLFSWYNELVQKSNLDFDSPEIVDSLKKSATSELQLAENIFNWVQHNIKYIAYEDGLGGFVPRTPESVLKNRFGDCKDMALLTKSLMNACDVPCHVAWVGTRSKCYSYETCPTPLVDNHMIAAYPGKDGLIFLDPTSSYSEFGMASSFIQGKEAMVRKSESDFAIIVVPTAEAIENQIYSDLMIKVDEEGFTGRGMSTIAGFEKVSYENALDYNSNTPDDLFQRFESLGNASFSVSNLQQKNTDSNKGVLSSSFDFKIDNCVESFDGTLYFNPFVRDVISFNLKNRKTTLDLDYKTQDKVDVRFVIPDGYRVKEFIESKKIVENGLTLIVEAKQTESELIISYSFIADMLEVDSDEIEEVNKTLKKMKKMLKQQISLTRI